MRCQKSVWLSGGPEKQAMECAGMTFYEAAVEVLKESKRPLHYKKITELAISKSLLSHVGKMPEATMESLLTEEAEKSLDATIVKVRKGVFSLATGVDPATLSTPETTSITLGEPPKAIPPKKTKEEVSTRSRRRRRRGTDTAGEDSGAGEKTNETESAPQEPAEDKAPSKGRRRKPRGESKPDTPAGPSPKRAPRSNAKSESEGPIEAIVAAESEAMLRRGHRPRYLRGADGWREAEQYLSREFISAYSDLEKANSSARKATVKALCRSVKNLQGGDLVSFVEAVLLGLGHTIESSDRREDSATVVSRPGDGLTPFLTATHVIYDGTAPEADGVAAVRGRLEAHGCRSGAIVVVGGRYGSSAVDEARAPGAPVELIDAMRLAELAVEGEVGVRAFNVRVRVPDLSAFLKPTSN